MWLSGGELQISRRVYKAPLSHDESVSIINRLRGKHFDADVVDAFLEIHPNFDAIAMTYSDSNEDLEKKANYMRLAQVMV
jgi:putative two-component system response regulator